MSLRLVPLVAPLLCLLLPGAACAQLTNEELTRFHRLLAEPDGEPAFEKRLRLVTAAVERESDPKRPPGGVYPVDLKTARIPAATGVPLLLTWLDTLPEPGKRTAVRMLGAYGPAAAAAVPKLRDALTAGPTPGVRDAAMTALAQVAPADPAVAAAILDRLDTAKTDHYANRAVLQALAAVAPALPKSAVARVEPFRDHRSADVGALAHRVIGKILARERPSLDQLQKLKTIDWKDTPDQGYATFAAIAEAGPKAEFAIPLLLAQLDAGPPPYIECVLLETAVQVRSGDPRLIAALLDRQAAKDVTVRMRARVALMNLAPREPAAVRALAQGLRHRDPEVRHLTAAVLRSAGSAGKLTPEGLDALAPPLLAAFETVTAEPPGHLDVYLSLLTRLGPRAAPAGDALAKLYQSDEYFKKLAPEFTAQVRGRLLVVLADLGVPEALRPGVLEILRKGPAEGTDGGFGFAAAARAAATFPDPAPAAPLLLPALTDKRPERVFYLGTGEPGPPRPTSARLEAIRALAKIGAPARDALPPLRELAMSDPAPPGSIGQAVQEEARRAYKAIVSRLDPGTAPPLPFVDGKRDFLHLDERLHVKMTIQLRNPRPQHVLKHLQDATGVPFSLDDRIDPAVPVWSSSHWNQTAAWVGMRQLAASASIQGAWQQVGDGYRLVRREGAEPRPAANQTYPPFRDDTNDPLPKDPRLAVRFTIDLRDATVPDLLQRIQAATGLRLTTDRVDTASPLYNGVTWPNTSAWEAMRKIAEDARVDGTWERTADGYVLRGKFDPPPPRAMARPPAPAPAPAVAPAPAQVRPAAPGSRLLLILGAGGVLILLLCLVAAVWLREHLAAHDVN